MRRFESTLRLYFSSEVEMKVDMDDPIFNMTTAEKIQQRSGKLLKDLGRKKSKTDRQEMPPLLPLDVPEVTTLAAICDSSEMPAYSRLTCLYRAQHRMT